MAKVMKTPGVYIVEKDAFPNSVVEVATAVPAFVGYTEKALNKEKSLKGEPRRVTSLTEFESYFGKGPDLEKAFGLTEKSPPEDDDIVVVRQEQDGAEKAYVLSGPAKKFYLYYSMVSFFQNGGGPCYIVSVGSYDDEIESKTLTNGITPLIKEQEPTMVVIPDAMLLDQTGCADVQQAALSHCSEMQSRFAVLDVLRGYDARDKPGSEDCVAQFRDALGINNLQWGAAYYPWIDTTIISRSDLSYECFDEGGRGVLASILATEQNPPSTPVDDPTPAQVKQQEKQQERVAEVQKITAPLPDDPDEDSKQETRLLNKTLIALSPIYSAILTEVQALLNRLPASGTMAGVYTMVDNTRGVWKAPANVSLAGVVKPAVNISHDEQEDLNVTPQGKSVNAIRSFVGEGTLVWGARTLDGNSLDWRYIQVRRTMIMLEQSIKLASKAYVFEANDANTWVTMKSLITNFLTGIWKRGGLAGASPSDAFSVHVGLGETMTPLDIQEGILKITVLVAPTRPAEFIEITFQQQMQKS